MEVTLREAWDIGEGSGLRFHHHRPSTLVRWGARLAGWSTQTRNGRNQRSKVSTCNPRKMHFGGGECSSVVEALVQQA